VREDHPLNASRVAEIIAELTAEGSIVRRAGAETCADALVHPRGCSLRSRSRS
jgi:hypothetical protein